MKGIQASNVIIISYVYIYITRDILHILIFGSRGKRRKTDYDLSNIYFISLFDISTRTTCYVLSEHFL